MHRPTYRKATLHIRLLVAVLLAAVWDTCTAQGLDLSRARPGLGATWTYDALHAAYSKTRKWQQAYTLAPRATCRNQSGSLCGAVDGSTEFVQLVLAASPGKYDARTDRPGQADAIAPPKDQRLCTTCVAFAVAAGASAAAATALRVPGATINFSEQDLFSCTWNLLCPWQPNVCGGAGVRLCVQDWDLKPALETLCSRPLAREACLPYNLDQNPEIRRVCDYQCKDGPLPLAAVAGSFSFRELRSDWEIQQHIRRNGAVVTSIDLYNDFKEFFAHNPQGIYPGPRPGAKFEAGHAIALVGYDQVGGDYVVKNSYGPSFAAGGFCKVRFGVANITRPGFTFGITFLPATPPQALLRVTPAPGKPGCYLYKASTKDYMEWLSDQTAIPLQKLLLDNVERVKDIGSIGGITLLLCNPDARNIIVPGQARPTNGTTPAAGPTQPSAAAATPAPGPTPSSATTTAPSGTTSSTSGTSSGLVGLAGLASLGRTAVAAPTANPTNQPPPPKPTGNATPDAGGVAAACEQCTQCSLCSKCTACSKPFALLDWEKDQACRTCAQCSGCPTSLTAPTIGGKRDLTQYGACANCLACAQCCGEGLFGGCKECGPCASCAFCKLNT